MSTRWRRTTSTPRHYYEGYTAAEIGRMMGAPSNTVLSWLRRARAQLHTMLKEEIEDEVV